MIWANLGDILIPIGRTVAGYVVAFLLAFLGDLLGRLFNLSIGYPWDPAVHQAIIYVSIGLGAGIGSYAAWANPRHPWRMMLLFGLIVVAAGIIGAYLGRIYGPGPDTSYWWHRYATDRTVYFVAAGVGTELLRFWGWRTLFTPGLAPALPSRPCPPMLRPLPGKRVLIEMTLQGTCHCPDSVQSPSSPRLRESRVSPTWADFLPAMPVGFQSLPE